MTQPLSDNIVTGSPVAEPAAEYLPIPREMNVFSSPALPAELEVKGRGRYWVNRIASCLEAFSAGKSVEAIDISRLADEESRFLGEILLHGEVSALILGEPEWQIEETAYVGLWRMRAHDPETNALLDRLVVGEIPDVIQARAASFCQPITMPHRDAVPIGIINAPHVLTELVARSKAFNETGVGYVVNLGLLPLTEDEVTWLVRSLGEGPAIILSGGYGICRIRSTRLSATWWVQYYNAADVLILNSLEIATVPSVACACRDDIVESAARIRALESAYL